MLGGAGHGRRTPAGAACCAALLEPNPFPSPHTHPPPGLPELRIQEPDTEYGLDIGLPMLAMVLLNLGLFAAFCWQAFRAARWAFSLFGPAQPLALAAAAAYLALSVWLYSRPVDALKLQGQRRRPGALAQSERNLAGLQGSEARKAR